MKLWREPLDQGRVARPRGVVHIRADWCKGCRYCVAFCPTQVLELSSGFNEKGYHYPILKDADACVDCKLCERLCPEYSIVVTSVAAQSAQASDAPRPASTPTREPAETQLPARAEP